jgi:hypothetical protein
MPRTGSQLRYLEVGVGEITTDLLKFLDSAGPLVMLQSKDSFIVKIFTRNEIDVSHRHDGLPISFRVIGRATKRILKAVHA